MKHEREALKQEIVTSKPAIVTSKPTIRKHASCYIGSDYKFSKISDIAGNSAVVGHMNYKSIHVYDLLSQQQQLTHTYSMRLPQGLDADCRKYILDDGRIVLRDLQGTQGPTHVYTSTLQPLKTYTGNYGILIGTMSPDLLAYSNKSSSQQGHEIRIYSLDNNHRLVMTIAPPGSYGNLSICKHPTCQYFVAVDASGRSLNIYNRG